MKKPICLFVACILLFVLCACGSEPTSTVKNTQYKLGESAKLDGIIVTFLEVAESSGTQFISPADGKVFVLCEFEIINNSKEDLAVSSMMSFSAFCDNYTCDYSIGALTAKGDKEQLDGTVAAGKKMKGVVGYELPTDWKELEIYYTPDVMSSDEIVFVANNN